VGFDETNQLLIRYSHSSDTGEKIGIHLLFIALKKAYDSVRREVLYNIPIEFGVPMKLITLSNMCLNETYIKVPIGKHLSGTFHIEDGLKEGGALSTLLSAMQLGRSTKTGYD
jgi:hypothetical protein